jgi:8-oxo-dGTP diphosphatase
MEPDGRFVQASESLDQAANRILKQLTGLEGVYLEQMYSFGETNRDPMERTVSVSYFALIDIHKYEKQISADFHAEWVPLKRIPKTYLRSPGNGRAGQKKHPL